MRATLTDAFLRTLKPPARGRLQITDTKSTGLMLRLTPGGAASWCFRCRDRVTGGLTPRLTIGRYPEVSLAEARTRAAEMRKQVLGGVPIETRPRQRAAAASKTFQHLADRYMTEHSLRRKKSAPLDAGNLRRHVLPHWGSRPYASIGRADVIALLEKLVSAGIGTQANRVQGLLSSIFSFAIDADLLQANPCARLRRRGVEQVGTRVLSDNEFRLFWPRIVEAPQSCHLGLALRLQLLTAARPGEVAGLALSELEYLDEPGKAVWLLPAIRSKNKRAHLVPLSEAARAVVLEAMALHTRTTAYLFPALSGVDRPVPAAALSGAMQNFAEGLRGQHLSPDLAAAALTWAAHPPTPHDLRRSASTRLSALGVPLEDRMATLNHTIAGATKRHYDLHQRSREKRHALETWAAALREILEPGLRGATVVPLR